MTLYDLAQKDNIHIDTFNMSQCKSASALVGKKCFIALSPKRIKSKKEELVCLAHELGHCETGSFYNMYAKCDIREKHERAADIWAIKKLIPKSKLEKMFKRGVDSIYELSDFFGVTECFMRKAINYYKGE